MTEQVWPPLEREQTIIRDTVKMLRHLSDAQNIATMLGSSFALDIKLTVFRIIRQWDDEMDELEGG